MIQPEKLRELDTTEIAIPYGNGARAPVQKYGGRRHKNHRKSTGKDLKT